MSNHAMIIDLAGGIEYNLCTWTTCGIPQLLPLGFRIFSSHTSGGSLCFTRHCSRIFGTAARTKSNLKYASVAPKQRLPIRDVGYICLPKPFGDARRRLRLSLIPSWFGFRDFFFSQNPKSVGEGEQPLAYPLTLVYSFDYTMSEVYLVTGANSGLGLDSVRRLALMPSLPARLWPG